MRFEQIALGIYSTCAPRCLQNVFLLHVHLPRKRKAGPQACVADRRANQKRQTIKNEDNSSIVIVCGHAQMVCTQGLQRRKTQVDSSSTVVVVQQGGYHAHSCGIMHMRSVIGKEQNGPLLVAVVFVVQNERGQLADRTGPCHAMRRFDS